MNQPTPQPPGAAENPAPEKPLICVGCKYDLRATDHASNCPECGKPVIASLPKLKPKPTPNPTIPCVGCGYDLRESDPKGNCPECGESVYKSIRKDSIALADPAWALKIADGTYWLYLSVLLIIPIIIAVLLIPLGISNITTLITLPTLLLIFNLLGHAAFGVILFKAQSTLALLEPDRLKPARSEPWRKTIVVTRIVCLSFAVVNIGIALAITLAELAGRSFIGDIGSAESETVFAALSILLSIEFMVYIIAFAGCASVMADAATRLENDLNTQQGNSIRNFLKISLGVALGGVLCIFMMVAVRHLEFVGCCLLPLVIAVGGMVSFINLLQVLFVAYSCSARIKFLVAEEAKNNTKNFEAQGIQNQNTQTF